MIKPLVVSHSDYQGGAARAAWRLHQSLVCAGVESRMIAGTLASGDWRVSGGVGKVAKGLARLRPTIDGLPNKLQRTPSQVLHSPAWISGVSKSTLNSAAHDVVNLHWTCCGFMSVALIGKMTKPIVWTMHDMWAFCGAEHYASDAEDVRWRHGYTRKNRPAGHSGFDVDRWVWNRKLKAWRSARQIVTPSRWLASCVKQSVLLQDWPVAVIPNALDTKVFKPVERAIARRILNLPSEKTIILFGALGGGEDPRKGWDLLQPALVRIGASYQNVHAVIFGQREPKDSPAIGMPSSWLGHIADDFTLALLYSAADVMVVPSRQENLPQSATEAQACGCPVVAFDATGLPDAVEHRRTGYLAEEITAESLEHALDWILSDPQRAMELSANARMKATNEWSYEIVARQYMELYSQTAYEFRKR